MSDKEQVACERLLMATKRGDKECTRLYFQQIVRHNPQSTTLYNILPQVLETAIERANFEILKLLLQKGEVTNIAHAVYGINREGRVLMQVAEEKNAKIANLFRQYSKKMVNTRQSYFNGYNSWFDQTPLVHAVEKGIYESVQCLIKEGANVSWAMNEAARVHDLGMLELLIEKAAQTDLNAAFLVLCEDYSLPHLKQNTDIVTFLIEHGADVNIKTTSGFTLLCKAMEKNLGVEFVEMLLQKGADPSVKVSSNFTCLEYLYRQYGKGYYSSNAYEQYKTLINKFTKNQRIINKQLFEAIEAGNLAEFRLLFENNPNIRTQSNTKGQSPLAVAILSQQLPIVEYLIQKDVDVCRMETKGNQTPLMLASEVGNSEICSLLLENGANLTVNTAFRVAIEHKQLAIVQLLLKNGADLNCTFSNGNTPLIQAILSDEPKIVECLLNAGADVNQVNENQDSPRDIAVQNNSQILTALIERGIDLKNNLKDGTTCLTHSIEKNDLQLAQLLIAKGADVNQADANGNLPINLALAAENQAIFAHLLQKGADITGIEGDKLVNFLDNNQLESLTELIQRGVDINVTVEGETLLHRCIRKNNREGLQLLLKNGADVKGRGSGETTTFALALEMDNYNVFKMLLDAKQDDEIEQEWLSIAARNGNFRIVDHLIKCGANVNGSMDELEEFAQRNVDFATYLKNLIREKQRKASELGTEEAAEEPW